METKSKIMKPSRTTRLKQSASRCALCLGTALLVLLTAALAPYAPAASGSDNYQPFVEPLQVTQKRAYYSAAPTGQDQPLSAPEAPITFAGPGIDRRQGLAPGGRCAGAQEAPTLEQTAHRQQSLEDELEQFGYDIFNRAPSTFAPVEGIPVPRTIASAPAINIVIQLFGKRNVEYSLVVTRDGKILMPEFGPVAVGGLTFDDAEKLITSGFEQRVIGARAVVTMGKLRTIQIRSPAMCDSRASTRSAACPAWSTRC
jgi:polysaccharide export outer membrane protein